MVDRLALLLGFLWLVSYVKSGAEKEINISGDLRKRVLQQVEKVVAEPAAVQPTAVASPFDPADKEIRKLIRDGRYLQAFSLYAAQNLSVAERRRRFYIGIIAGVISLALFFGLLFGVDDGTTSRLARICTILPNITFVTFLLSSRLGV